MGIDQKLTIKIKIIFYLGIKEFLNKDIYLKN